MSPEKTQKLRDTYPDIFDPNFIFECDDGWFELISDCAEDLRGLKDVPKASCVKEKLGGLRFYCDTSPFGENAITGYYEKNSYYHCEICGSWDGKLCRNDYNWLKTVCPKHRVITEHGYTQTFTPCE